ncbi:MAG: hypothetical protein AAGC86_09850 [Pseudomonadota bacterium]
MPNIIAYVVLLSWPIAAVVMFQRLPVERAVIWGILAPFMILPSATGVDLPAVPAMDKTTLPNLMLLIMMIAHARQKIGFLPESVLGRVLLFLMVAGPFMTALTNSDPLIFQAGYIPGLSIYDAVSSVAYAILMIAPFIVARNFLASRDSHRMLVKALVLSALIYSVPMLFEIRMSPQLHNWIYGFYQHSFGQQMRAGGFRPMVMMSHGLTVAFFTMLAIGSATALWRASKSDQSLENGNWMIKLLFLLILLILCKSLASLIYGLLAIVIIAFCSIRTQLRLAALLALLAILYPILRGAELIPVETMVDLARSYSEDRAASLRFRFDNEADLLARASERVLFGWGGWSRNHIHNPITGAETSITDGYWIILIGSLGWVGFLATFGLLALPIFRILRKASRDGEDAIPPETAALCILLALVMVDLIPNAFILPLSWLIVGSLLGFSERISETADKSATKAEEAISTKRPRTVL